VSRRAVAQGAGSRGPIGNLLAQAEESRMSASTCLAYWDDGTLCRAPASILDHQRGGMVCLQHVPDEVAEEITLSLKMGTVEGRIDHDREVYTWRLEESEAFDTSHGPTHGPRRDSCGEVRQAERDETCLYVCTLCDQVADPTLLEGAHDGP
jgi:hypothetical protein